MKKTFMTSAERRAANASCANGQHASRAPCVHCGEGRTDRQVTAKSTSDLSRKWKIITFETETGERLPIIFPAALTHRHLGKEVEARAEYLGLDDEELKNAVDIANRLTAMDDHKSWRSLKPISAGFVSGLRVESVHGESETLQLKADPRDRDFINQCEA